MYNVYNEWTYFTIRQYQTIEAFPTIKRLLRILITLVKKFWAGETYVEQMAAKALCLAEEQNNINRNGLDNLSIFPVKWPTNETQK